MKVKFVKSNKLEDYGDVPLADCTLYRCGGLDYNHDDPEWGDCIVRIKADEYEIIEKDISSELTLAEVQLNEDFYQWCSDNFDELYDEFMTDKAPKAYAIYKEWWEAYGAIPRTPELGDAVKILNSFNDEFNLWKETVIRERYIKSLDYV